MKNMFILEKTSLGPLQSFSRCISMCHCSLGHQPLPQRCVVAWEHIAIPKSPYTSFCYTIPLTKLFSECVQAHFQLASGKRGWMIKASVTATSELCSFFIALPLLSMMIWVTSCLHVMSANCTICCFPTAVIPSRTTAQQSHYWPRNHHASHF